MRVKITGKFGSVQRQIIRTAAIVAQANFPMPSTVEIRKLSRAQAAEMFGMVDQDDGIVYLSGNRRDANLFSDASHEYRHVSDRHVGNLDSDAEHFYWKGRKVAAKLRHADRPHEKVAYAYENRLIPKKT